MPDFITVALIIIAAIIVLGVALFATTLSLRGVLTIAYNGELSVDYRVLFFKIPFYPLPKSKERKRRRQHMSVRAAERIKRRQKKKEERLQKLRSFFKSEKKEPEKKPSEEKKPATKASPLTKEQLKDALTDAVDIVAALTEIISVVVKRFTHHLRIKVARFKIKIATEDAALTAVTYGSVSQIINVLLPILSTVKNFDLPKRKDFDVSADFSTTKTEIDVKVSFTLRVWHLADIGLRSLFGGFGKLFSRRKNAKYPIPFIRKSIAEILEGFGKSGEDESKTSQAQKKEKN